MSLQQFVMAGVTLTSDPGAVAMPGIIGVGTGGEPRKDCLNMAASTPDHLEGVARPSLGVSFPPAAEADVLMRASREGEKKGLNGYAWRKAVLGVPIAGAPYAACLTLIGRPGVATPSLKKSSEPAGEGGEGRRML